MNLKFSKKTMCILFVLLMVFISLGTVSAMEVNSTDDNGDSLHNQLELENDNEKLSILNDDNIISSTETFNGTTFSELQNKINSLNNSDVLDLTSNVTQDGNSQINISKSITINGNGVTIDAQGKSRIFYINSGATVVLNNITFTNGYASTDGGAIYFNGSGSVENCNFINNKALGNGGAVYVSNALSNSKIGSTFINNSANNGGAIYFNGAITNITINGSFKDNTAERAGGAIYVREQSLNNSFSSEFQDNQAKRASGGAIFFYRLSENNSFEGFYRHNYALYGGGVFFYKKANNNKFNSEFISNIAKSCGGAIFFYNTTNNNSFTGDFINNSALGQVDETNGNGGAITFKDVSTNCVFTCDFINNNATKNGGGVNYRQTPHNITFNSDFINNTSPNGGGVNFFESFENIIFNGEFIGNSAINGGAIAAREGIIKDVLFKNNSAEKGGAVYFNDYGDVANCNFANNTASTDGGAVYSYGGSVTNCNFTSNEAENSGGAFRTTNGNVENCNFYDNSAYEGGAVYILLTGVVENCNFVSNVAYEGGAVTLDNGDITNCNFSYNAASNDGGALYFYGDGDVANCNFTYNSATSGSAIFFKNYKHDEKTISNSYFINNKANVDNNTPLQVTLNGNNVEIIFFSQNNDLNAIYSPDYMMFTNVTYWGANGIANTENYYTGQSNMEAGQNITITGIVNGRILNTTKTTDDYGKIVLEDITGDYFILIRHEDDSYYTEAETVLTNIKLYTNITSVATNNKTVNITAKSNVFHEYTLRQLIFIISDGTKLNATYDSNGTWWAVHTFDDYTEYNVNGSYIGLSNVTVNNATVNITKADSTIAPIKDITIYYHDSIEVIVSTEGAIGVIAIINDDEVNVINNYTIPISGLSIGNYTLTVTTVPDEDHNPVTTTAEITVIKAPSRITLIDELITLYANETVSDFAALTPEDAGTLNYTSSNEDVAKIIDGKIIAVGAGKAKITVSYAGNENYTAAENKSLYVIVTPLKTRISANKTEFELVVGDEADIIANATLEGLAIEYATDDTNIISVDKNGHITALSNGTAIIFVSVGDNRIYDYSYVGVIVTVKKTTEIDVNVSSEENDVTITATVDSSASGLVKFNISGEVVYVDVNNGKAVYELVHAAGDYNVEATYMGDSNFNPNSTSKSFTVAGHVKQDTTIAANVAVNNATATIEITLNENATGSVTVAISGKTFIVPVENGKAVFTNDYQSGTYTANITYIGDIDFNANTTTTTFTITEQKVDLKNTTISVDVKASENDVEITATVDSSASGLVEFNIDGKAVYVALNNGKAVYNTNLPAGDYNVEAIYLGDSKFNANRTSKEFAVAGHVKQNTTIDSNVIVENYNVTITVTVNENATGFVKFTLNGNDLFAEVKDGTVIINSIMPVGNYTITAAYLGDDDFNTNTTDIQVEVPEIPLKDTAITAETKVNENNITITVNIDENATGFIKFEVTGPENYTLYMEVTDGKAVLEDVLTAGNYTAQITFLGNGEYNPNSTTETFTVVGHIKKDTTITAVPKVDGTTVTIVATVDTNATGHVTIGVLGQTFIVPVENGKAVFTYDFTPATYSANIVYLGDDDFNSATTTTSFTVIKQTVVLKDTEISVDVSSIENNVTITANIDVSASGLIEFSILGKTYYIPVNNGKAALDVVLPAGDYDVDVTYIGDDKFNANRTSKAFSVSDHIKQNTTITPEVTVNGNNVTITVNLNSNATGFVKFMINGDDVFDEVKGGKVFLITVLPAGNYTIPIEYLGDNDFNGNATEITFTIAAPESYNVTIIIPEDIKAGDNISIGVEIPNATGNVTAIFDGKETTVPLVNGSAAVPLENISAGNHSIVVIYDGDEMHAPTHSTVSISVPEEPVAHPTATRFANITISDKNITAILVDETGSAIPNAVIAYTVGGAANTTTTAANGSFTITGEYGVIIAIDYAGNDTYLATNTSIKFDNMTQTRLATQFNVTNGYRLQVYAVDYKAGERGAYFDVLLTDTNGKRLANQSVVFAINGWVHNKTTDANGVAHLQINLQDANYYTCAPCYLGNTTYEATFASAMLDVIKKPITITAAAKSYKATAKTKKYTVTLKTIKGSSTDGKTYLSAGKKVTLKINGKTYTAKINAKGQATFSIKLTKKGKFQSVINFAGDKTYESASKKVIITVK